MNEKSVLRDKSFAFATSIVELCRILKDSKQEYVICRQLIRSGTAVGALIREAEFAQSKADFINKLSIALKEANETSYWLELLVSCQCIEKVTFQHVFGLLTEIIKMLTASVNTLKNNVGKSKN
jgi:four helix bundle protein